ncbi:MAG TPA: protein-glutamate O-methyltransferase CheR, partial [Syntrophobacteria bacterium]|nr:protein-glutamate O-methyltransferase CheR [Syntrophobacteria bacterium]
MEYREFLKGTLPLLGLRWRRFRTRTMRRRIIGRLQDLGLCSLPEYRAYLLSHPEEQRLLVDQLTVTISRFWRNRFLFEALERTWLPMLLASVRPGEPFRVWSAGCASGEEPYSFLILWAEEFADSGHKLRLVASDADSRCLRRAREGRYPPSSLRELPLEFHRRYFTTEGGNFVISPAFVERILWMEHNLLRDPPVPGNHLILCRNLAYTYFTEPVQQEITRCFHQALLPSGLLVIGRKDQLPWGAAGLFGRAEHPVYQRLEVG